MRSPAAISSVAAAVALFAAPAWAATATLKDAEGREVGSATLTETPHGVLVRAELFGLPPGEHGFHIHETGACAPDFEAAGGHFAGSGAEHGYLSASGPHDGDMPNIHVPDSGELTVEAFVSGASLSAGDAPILDEDGAALLVHADPDDYETQPSGHAGDRIACGVIEP